MRWIACALALGLLLVAPASLASEAGGDVELSVVAQEDGCPGDDSLCYEIVDGNLSEVEPGSDVTIHFENRGEAEHELMVRTLGGTMIAPPSEAPSEEHGSQSHESSGSTHEGDDNETANGSSQHHGDDPHDSEHDGEANETEDDHHASEEEHADEDANETHDDQGSNETAENGTTSHGGDSGGHQAHLVPPGGNRTLRFTLPSDAEGIYLWCSLPGHEEAGMAEQARLVSQASQEEPLATPGLALAPTLLVLTAVGVLPVAVRAPE